MTHPEDMDVQSSEIISSITPTGFAFVRSSPAEFARLLLPPDICSRRGILYIGFFAGN